MTAALKVPQPPAFTWDGYVILQASVPVHQAETLAGRETELPGPEMGVEVPLSAVYQRVAREETEPGEF